MDSRGLDDFLPPWVQAVITIIGAVVVFGLTLLGKLRDPSPVSRTQFSRADFADLFANETQKNRDVLVSNREMFTAMRDSLSSIAKEQEEHTRLLRDMATSNTEILRLVRDQVSDARYNEIAERIMDRLEHNQRPPRS